MTTEEVIDQSFHPNTDANLEHTSRLSASVKPNQSGIIGRFRRWASTTASTPSDDDPDELELQYRHWSCCS